MAAFLLGDRLIGGDAPPLVVPEIGINHGGDVAVALDMIDAAADAGAEIVKFQTHVIDDEMSHHAEEVIPGNADVSIRKIMADCALNEAEEARLKDHAESRGLIYLSTPFSRAAADRLEALDVVGYKIGSGECNNLPLVAHIAAFGKPIILSTGMNSIDSVERTVAVIRDAGVPFALLHCTNVYPTPPELIRLGGMVELSQAFPDAVIGLSDHSVTNHPCIGAVALGADILERHFVDRLDRDGPDVVCSMDPTALGDLIEGSRIVRAARGGTKGPVPAEEPTIAFAFASVVAIADIEPGDELNETNVWVKRPGTGGIPASDLDRVYGGHATQPIPRDAQLSWEMIQSA